MYTKVEEPLMALMARLKFTSKVYIVQVKTKNNIIF